MPFRDIPGQDRAKAQLRTALRTGTLSHAYVFEGPAGTGRKAAALALAQALHCADGGDDACGSCAACRRIGNGNHPDVMVVDPDGASVKIDQVRELQRRFANRAESVKPRVYVIEEADRLTTQAANALLKFLEEPGSATVAILLTENAGALLPTIRSRAQPIRFAPLPPETIEAALLAEGHPPELARPAARLAPGLAPARELLQNQEFAEIRNAVLQLAKESASGFAAAVASAQAVAGKGGMSERLDMLLDMFILWCKDMIVLQRDAAGAVVMIDRSEPYAAQAASRRTEHWVSVMDEALRAKRRLRGHANPQLVLERFLFALQGGGT